MISTKEKYFEVQQEDIPKKLGQAYLRIGAITFVLGSNFILTGLWFDHISGQYPSFTIALTATLFLVILFDNSKIIKKSIEKPCP